MQGAEGEGEETAPWGPDNGFTWHSPEELTGVSTDWGRFGPYSGGGYVVHLPSPLLANASVAAREQLQRLQATNWIDAKTRAVFVEFNLYNHNENFFCVVTLLCEFPTVGGALASFDLGVRNVCRSACLVFYPAHSLCSRFFCVWWCRSIGI